MRFIRPLLAALALAFAVPSLAQDVPPVDSALTVRLSQNWTLHPLASVSAASYSLTTHSVGADLVLSGLYEVRYKDLVGLAAGLGFQTGPVSGATATGLVTFPYHLAAGVQYAWIGAVHDLSIVVTPTFRF